MKIIRYISSPGYVSTIMGLGFLITAMYLFIDHRKFMSVAKDASGEVIEINIVDGGEDADDYIPVIKYYAGTQEVVASPDVDWMLFPYSENAFHIGQKIYFRYDPTNPQKIHLMGFFDNWGIILVFGIVGFISLIIGFILLLILRRKKESLQWLKNNGQKIQANFISIALNDSTTIEGKYHPFVIYCSWVDPVTGITCNFQSKDILLEDPTRYIPATKKIPVLIDPQNPQKRYLIDFSFLPPTFLKNKYTTFSDIIN